VGGDSNDDLTDRFKYKVQALMGSFDPPLAEMDTELVEGNIVGAMLQFPARYSFTAIGKATTASSTDDQEEDVFVQQVRDVIRTESGRDDDDIKARVRRRGTKYIKVSCEVEVDSALIIGNIYERLNSLELCVMRF